MPDYVFIDAETRKVLEYQYLEDEGAGCRTVFGNLTVLGEGVLGVFRG